MIKFCKLNDTITICDDATIKKYNLVVIKTITEEEYKKCGSAYHIKNGEIILGRSQEELNQMEINNLKQQLAEMDYKSSKYVDGEYTQEEWAEIVAERKAIRERIRELEKIIY